ncbi:unnamed protein product [Choristocarpus tenellus]
MPSNSSARTEALETAHLLKIELERVQIDHLKGSDSVRSRCRLGQGALDAAKDLSRTTVGRVVAIQDKTTFLDKQVSRYKDQERRHARKQGREGNVDLAEKARGECSRLRIENKHLLNQVALLKHRVEILTGVSERENLLDSQLGEGCAGDKCVRRQVPWSCSGSEVSREDPNVYIQSLQNAKGSEKAVALQSTPANTTLSENRRPAVLVPPSASTHNTVGEALSSLEDSIHRVREQMQWLAVGAKAAVVPPITSSVSVEEGEGTLEELEDMGVVSHTNSLLQSESEIPRLAVHDSSCFSAERGIPS